MEKELKIEIPKGYEIDKEKATFEKIVFKKIDNRPKTWEEYCELTKGIPSFYSTLNGVDTNKYSGEYNEFTTKERAEQFIALGKLLQLRDYWVSNLKNNSNNFVAVIYHFDGEIVNTNVSKKRSLSYSLTFPTREMAQKFIECFKDLINEAYPLI